ncbi:sensor histidine kinase [Christensenellaceae bacterium OttesenSCG-928-L17]|nr:sensor histidine kinase [Christensenellaceae bacterium OttesenSCG-928-L17]
MEKKFWFRFRNMSVRYLLRLVFTTIIVSFALVSGVSLLYFGRMSREHNRQIQNIEFANQASQSIQEEIMRENWYLLAGRTTLEDSRNLVSLETIENNLQALYEQSSGDAGREYIEAASRGANTLRQYVLELRRQVAEGDSVFNAQRTLEDIEQVSSNINDALQEFIYAQTNAIGEANSQMQEVTRVMMVFIAVMSIANVILAVAAYHVLKRATERLAVEMAAMAERVLQGDLKTQVPPAGLEEFNRVTENINLMGKRIGTLLDERIHEQKNRQKAEIRALQAQITPHFLYNTLDTIVWLAEGGYNDKVVEVAIAFSNFYRVMLSSGKDYIRVEEEFAHVRDYLIIQKVRYQNILNYEITLDPALAEQRMLKLLLQPLVENALYHGIKNKRGGGMIFVTGEQRGEGHMFFTVRDNGIGISEERLCQLREEITGDSLPETAGYGLYNVNRRITLYYGAADLQVESEAGKGTTISFLLPMQATEQLEEE